MSNDLRGIRDSDGNLVNTHNVYRRGVTLTAVSTGTTAGSTANFSSGVDFVELVASALLLYTVGSSTYAATSASTPLPPNTPRIIPLGPSTASNRIHAIGASGAATLYATELNP